MDAIQIKPYYDAATRLTRFGWRVLNSYGSIVRSGDSGTEAEARSAADEAFDAYCNEEPTELIDRLSGLKGQ